MRAAPAGLADLCRADERPECPIRNGLADRRWRTVAGPSAGRPAGSARHVTPFSRPARAMACDLASACQRWVERRLAEAPGMVTQRAKKVTLRYNEAARLP